MGIGLVEATPSQASAHSKCMAQDDTGIIETFPRAEGCPRTRMER